jgi:hypothetical protein
MTTATKTTTKRTKQTPTQDTGLQIESLRPSMAEVERMIEYFRQDMDFQNIRITPVIQTQGQRICYGHFTLDEIWQTSDGKGSHEIQISAEHLARPAMDIAATVRHELIHAKNWECKVKDCSNNGKYHNGKFKASAESYGLICGEKTASNGYGITTFDAVYAAQVLGELQPDETAFTLARQLLAKRKAKQATAMLKWACGCTIIRAAVEVDATCNACGEIFAKV